MPSMRSFFNVHREYEFGNLDLRDAARELWMPEVAFQAALDLISEGKLDELTAFVESFRIPPTFEERRLWLKRFGYL